MLNTKVLFRNLIVGLSLVVVSVVVAEQELDVSADMDGNLLAGLIIRVSDIERSIAFYTDVIGLKTVGRVDDDGHLVEILLSTTGKFLNGMMLTLQPAEEGQGISDTGSADFGTLIFMVPSNDKVAARAKAAGFEATERDAQHLMVRDPDGYQLMFYQLDPKMLSAAK